MGIKLNGKWKAGIALDYHSISSEYLGEDEYGHKQFKTIRSEIGELVYQLKYNQDQKVIPDIITKIKEVKGIEKFDLIIAAPPSKKDRKFQPVFEVCKAISEEYKIPCALDMFTKNSSEVKNVEDNNERTSILKNSISFDNKIDIIGKDVLVVDDLYQTGTTLNSITEILYEKGKVEKVCVLTLTKTRTN